MDIKQLYNDNLWKLPNEYGDVSVMTFKTTIDILYTQFEFLQIYRAIRGPRELCPFGLLASLDFYSRQK